MKSRTLEIIVSPQGETRIETKGFVGSSCREASQFLEQAMGIRADEKLTAEFYEQQPAQQSLRQGGAA
jgi:hypothetical protein